VHAKRIGILVVAYNAESTLASVLHRIPRDVLDKVEEIFVFDDASQDDTFRVGSEFQRDGLAGKLTIHRNTVNRMYGGNQKVGYRYAIDRGLDIVVLLHGDGQYAPEVMQRLLEPLERDEAELVMGSRMLESGAAIKGGMPLYKYLGNRILTTFQNVVAGTSLSEFHSGYRAYAVQTLRSIDLDRLTDGWHFDTQIILELLARGGRVLEVPIPTYYGDEICYVNGVPYAWECVKTTLSFAWRDRVRGQVAVRPSQPPIE
jgi:glycosyltransferase involved in cell wall biosynthesis